MCRFNRRWLQRLEKVLRSRMQCGTRNQHAGSFRGAQTVTRCNSTWTPSWHYVEFRRHVVPSQAFTRPCFQPLGEGDWRALLPGLIGAAALLGVDPQGFTLLHLSSFSTRHLKPSRPPFHRNGPSTPHKKIKASISLSTINLAIRNIRPFRVEMGDSLR